VIFSVISVAGVIGLGLMGSSSGTVELIGVIALIVAVIGTTGYTLLSRRLSAEFSPFERTYMMIAVGAVVINRVLSGVFPDTLSGVVYQRGQFSPVGSGRLALALSAGKATDSCYQAAREAMSGYTNVGNCVFFRTPVPGLEGIQIGGHIFY
jgi:spore germination cell wall hydrolase CwlJ-like protein